MPLVPLTLEGRTIRLQPLALSDLDSLCAIGLEPKLWEATTIQVRTKQDMDAYIRSALRSQSEGTALPFVIREKNSDTIVGATRYHSIVSEHKHLEIGFTWIALPWQRSAVNTESKLLLLQHAFETLGFIRVEFRADAENLQSRKSLERTGARLEGVLRSYRISAARGIRDLAVYSIVSSEWPSVRSKLEAKLQDGRSDGNTV